MSALPSWTDSLRCNLSRMAEGLTSALHGWRDAGFTVTPEQCGYEGGLATVLFRKLSIRPLPVGAVPSSCPMEIM